MGRRLLLLLLALPFVAGFAFLTISAAVDQGITLASLVAIFVLALILVGTLSALLHPPDK
jgi:predicted neutral ceramidase superfamily lipid hydrolase